MIILTQASGGGMRIFLAHFIAIGLFALAAWGTHWIWYFRSFGMRGNLVLNARYFLGVIGLVIPIVGIIHGVAIWAGFGARVGDDDRTTLGDLPIVPEPFERFFCCAMNRLPHAAVQVLRALPEKSCDIVRPQ
jgi:hypothetical protein